MGSPKAENLLKFELGLSIELIKRRGKKPSHLQRITDVSVLGEEPSLSTMKNKWYMFPTIKNKT